MKDRRKKAGIRLAAVLAFILLFTGCGQSKENTSLLSKGQSDVEYIQEKGTLVAGITDFAPMDYKDGKDWKGFDADLARAFAKSLDVDLEFVEIDWDKKTDLLEEGKIDCIWNAMTLTEDLQKTISCTDPYLSNAQVVVLRQDDLEEYASIEDCQHMLFAVESGSTGEALLKDLNYRYSVYPTQKEALESVQEKKADATVIDIVMAAYYTDEGQDFEDLAFDLTLNDEKLCVGFRKDSDLTEQANTFLRAAYEDGTIQSLAEEYGIERAVAE